MIKFIVVGAAKSGTTFLLSALRNNPEIYLPNTNELYYHSKQVDFKGPFDASLLSKQTKTYSEYCKFYKYSKKEHVKGEFATDYLYFYENSIRSIVKCFGREVKILIVLRNPVYRTLSQYNHLVSKKHENLPFWEAIEKEKERKEQGWRWAYRYTEVSMYSEQVKAYLDAFDNVKVVIYEEIKSDKHKAIWDMERFIGVGHYKVVDIDRLSNIKSVYDNKIHYRSERFLRLVDYGLGTRFVEKYSKKYSKRIRLDRIELKKLYMIFERDIENLERVLSRNLSIWKV